jgi:hypothetical protein
LGRSGLYRLRKKAAAGRKSNPSGAKALMLWLFTARLKSCPDTKHESGGSSGCRRGREIGAFSPGLKPNVFAFYGRTKVVP